MVTTKTKPNGVLIISEIGTPFINAGTLLTKIAEFGHQNRRIWSAKSPNLVSNSWEFTKQHLQDRPRGRNVLWKKVHN